MDTTTTIDGHRALREMLRVTGPVAILRNGPLRQAVLALLTDRDELAVNLARADEENDRLRKLAYENEGLGLAVADLLRAQQTRPSCQIGMVDRCMCMACATNRARATLGPNV